MAEDSRPRTDRPATRLALVFGADLRSLALFRIALAAGVIADVLSRAADLSAHYTDAGVLRRSDLLETFSWLHNWPICIHLIGGAFWSQALLFVLHALFAACMLVGYRTRLATCAVWLFTMSVQLRNLYIGQGFDAELRMMLFWGCFVPLGARYALDCRRRPLSPKQSNHLLSVGTASLFTQLVIIYLSTGEAKFLHGEWTQGTAVAAVLNNELWATRTGIALLRFPALCHWLTSATLLLELAAPILLFAPIFSGPIRTATVFSLCCMHLGFALGLRVGIFPWVSIAALLCLLPPWFWDVLLPRVAAFPGLAPLAHWLRAWWARPAVAHVRTRLLERLGSTGRADASGVLDVSSTARLSRNSWRLDWQRKSAATLSQLACALFLGYVIFWNIGVVRDPAYEAPPWIGWLGSTFFLQQDWRMFASIASRTGWLLIPGRLKDGTQLDLFQDGGPLPHWSASQTGEPPRWTHPSPILYQVKDYRWLGFIDRLAFGKRGDEQRLLYGRYLCREWNGQHDGMQQLETLDMFFMSRPVLPEYPHYTDGDYEQVLLWTHRCFG